MFKKKTVKNIESNESFKKAKENGDVDEAYELLEIELDAFHRGKMEGLKYGFSITVVGGALGVGLGSLISKKILKGRN